MDWRRKFDERELQEIKFCETYKNQFGHGTDGHLVRTVVAKMASILDDNQSSMPEIETDPDTGAEKEYL